MSEVTLYWTSKTESLLEVMDLKSFWGYGPQELVRRALPGRISSMKPGVDISRISGV